MMDVEQQWQSLSLNASTVLAELLNECSAIMDYRTLRDSLPRRLAHLLQCRCVLLYQRIGETLQFAAGTFDDVPGWSASLPFSCPRGSAVRGLYWRCLPRERALNLAQGRVVSM